MESQLHANLRSDDALNRSKRIHKLHSHEPYTSPRSRVRSEGFCAKQDGDVKTRAHSFLYNPGHSSEESSDEQTNRLSRKCLGKSPALNQELLHEELLKILEVHCPPFCPRELDPQVGVKDYKTLTINSEIGFTKPIPLSVEQGFTRPHLSIKIKKPTDYEFCYIGPAKEVPILKSFANKKVKALVSDSINFDTLRELLQLLFTHRLHEIDLCVLTPHEVGIFEAVLERKSYTLAKRVNVMDLSSVKPTINLNPRRSEEKFKFIIKRIIKHLKKKDRIKTEEEFYEIYFRDLSNKIDVPIDHFYDPHNKLLKNRHFKSLSTDYVMLLLRSDQFLIELLYYLDNNIIEDHVESLKTKVGNLAKKWECIYNNHQKSSKSADFIRQLILNTEKGSKLPWSVNEVREAIDLMKNIIYNWNTQKFMR